MVNLKSRFLDEIPEELLQAEGYNLENKERVLDSIDINRIGSFTSESAHPYDSMLQIGTTVLHSHWGEGVILYREGYGENLTLIVVFRGGMKKKLMAKYADLEIIN